MSLKEELLARIIDKGLRDLEVNISGSIDITVSNTKTGSSVKKITVPITGKIQLEPGKKEDT